VARHGLVYLVNLELNYFEQVVVAQFIENNDFIEAVYEFRIECLAHR